MIVRRALRIASLELHCDRRRSPGRRTAYSATAWDVGNPAELRQHLAARSSPWQLPDAIVFVPEIPHTSAGKLRKSSLREMFAGWDWDRACL